MSARTTCVRYCALLQLQERDGKAVCRLLSRDCMPADVVPQPQPT